MQHFAVEEGFDSEGAGGCRDAVTMVVVDESTSPRLLSSVRDSLPRPLHVRMEKGTSITARAFGLPSDFAGQ